MKYDVLYTQSANRDLQNIHRYISVELKSPEIAQKFTSNIMEQIEKLDEMPKRYPLYDKESWRSRGLRKLIIGKFVAFYLVVEEKHHIVVLSIMYGGRDIDKLI